MRHKITPETGSDLGKPSYNVSVIGSFRQHYNDVVEAIKDLISTGFKVVSPPVSVIINPGAEYVRFEIDPTDALDHEIQSATLRKILGSDLVYVVAPNGYIGRTTSYELGRIHENSIPVYYSQHLKDMPIAISESDIVAAADLARNPHVLQRLTERGTGAE